MPLHHTTSYKMPLFNSTQISILQDMAISRTQQLEMESLQPYADYLYDIIVEDLVRDKSLIFSDLMRATRDATNPETINVPFWRFISYITATETFGDDRRDSYIGVSETSSSQWNKYHSTVWVLAPVAMDTLFRKTDLCARLSLFLGEENFQVGVRADYTGWNQDDDCCYNDLFIRFFPRGVCAEQRARIEAVKVKYNSYYTPRPLGEDEVIERSGDACRPPRTPDLPPATATTAPPPIAIKRPSTLVAESEDDEPVSPPCFCEPCMHSRYGDEEQEDNDGEWAQRGRELYEQSGL